MNYLLYAIAIVGTGVAAVVLSFVGFLGASKLQDDPTVGGAYVAMFMLTAIPVFIVGSFTGALMFRRLTGQ